MTSQMGKSLKFHQPQKLMITIHEEINISKLKVMVFDWSNYAEALFLSGGIISKSISLN